MILNETALAKAMGEDWKEDGYTALGFQVDGDPWLGLIGQGWAAAVERSNAPRKVLAAIAQHAGDLPGVGHAWALRKDVPDQLADFDYASELLTELMNREPEDGLLTRTRLMLGTRRLWQNTADGEIWLMKPELTNIAAADTSRITPCQPWLRMQGMLSVAVIARCIHDEDDEQLLKHLEKVRWI